MYLPHIPHIMTKYTYEYDPYEFNPDDYTPEELVTMVQDICDGTAVPGVKTVKIVQPSKRARASELYTHNKKEKQQ